MNTVILKIGFRNLIRQKRRNMLLGIGISFGIVGLGLLAGRLGFFACRLFFLTDAFALVGALPVGFGQALLFFQVTLVGFLQLAQRIGALVAGRCLDLVALDVGTLLANLDIDLIGCKTCDKITATNGTIGALALGDATNCPVKESI